MPLTRTSQTAPARICGLVLAAGAGTRFGGPKALARDADGTPWVALAVRMLMDAGCADVVVVLGASGPEASLLVPGDARVVIAADWREGLGASLRAGLRAVFADGRDAGVGDGVGDGAHYDAVLVTPVDTPDSPPAAAVRVVQRGMDAALHRRDLDPLPARSALARAVYSGTPGHPVLVGAHHWRSLSASLGGDSGAGRYLREHRAVEVECGDLWSGADIDQRPV